MSPLDTEEGLLDRAKALIARFSDNYSPKYGFGSMSCALYDTAWVSMVSKPVDGHRKWLFPETFQYVVDRQLETGAWSSYASQIDGILNTAAALLALKRHDADPLQIPNPFFLAERIKKGIHALSSLLNQWDVESTVHVGFEYLVPSLLKLLEDEGLSFQFPGRTTLFRLHDTKMAKFKPAYVYGKEQLTMIHSLEALIGRIDFDQVAHHKVMGSMMASPSSTSAYLIHASKWDHEAEDYLRHVMQAGPGLGAGGIPSAYPSTNFEAAWVNGFSTNVIHI